MRILWRRIQFGWMKGRRKRMKKISDIVKEMILGILVSGVCVALIGLIFVPARIDFIIGLFLGMAVAILMIFSMNHSIEKALDYDEKGAQIQSIKGYILRMIFLIAGFVAVYFVGWWSVGAYFLGIMCMKAAAYLQPYTKKFLHH